MSKFKSNKPQTPSRKKRAGEYKGKDIRSSDYLPSVFQTNLNKSWLNATFDQMISKSDLKDVDELVGNRDGKFYQVGDIYMQTPAHTARGVKQFEPAIVSRNPEQSVTNIVSIDDVANSINLDFDQYNYNAAYQTRSSTFLPPINVDKFLNYGSYYWVPNIPVYESINTQITYTDVVAEINHEIEYTFKDDDNEFELMDGMVIEFTSGYGDWDGWQVIVTGVGDLINLRPYRDATGRALWHDFTTYSGEFRGYWDRGQITLISKESNSYADPWSYIDNFNDNKPEPLIQFHNPNLHAGYDISTKKPVYGKGFYASGRTIIRWDTDWDFTQNTTEYDWALNFTPSDLDLYKVFVLDVDVLGDVEITCILDAARDSNGNITQFIPTDINNEFQDIAESIENWDVGAWDNDYKNNAEKDYIVIDRADPVSSAWSRVNMWVHRDTLFKVGELTNTSNRFLVTRDQMQAKRPIIEFDKTLWMENHGQANYSYSEVWHGSIDFIVDTVAEGDALGKNTTFVALGENKVYRSTGVGHTVVSEISPGDTLFLMTGGTDALIEKYQYQDVYLDSNGEYVVAQIKSKINQPPLFKLFDEGYEDLDDTTKYPNSDYTGSYIFGYKVGTGVVDPELRFPLAYKDNGFKAEIVFENYLDTDQVTYNKTLSTGSQLAERSVILGDYYYKKGLHLKTNYQASYKPVGSLTEYQSIVTDASVPLEIPVGSDQWETKKEFLYYEDGANFKVRELYMKGIYHDFDQNRPELIMQRNKKYVMHDLVGDLTILDKNFNSVTGYHTASTTAPDTWDIEFDSNANSYYYYGSEDLGFARIIVVDDISQVYHKIYIDGQFVPASKYSITADKITIPADLLKKDSVVDLQYYSGELTYTTDTQIPETHFHNATNETLTELTVGSTLGHWRSIIESAVGFEGQSHGLNNTHHKFSVNTNGGTIYKHDDLSVMHDITLSDDLLNVTEALVEQGTEWENFKARFIGQVRSLYSQQGWASVKDIVNQAINNITVTRRGTELHSDSNMVYTSEENSEVIVLENEKRTFTTRFTFNSDRTIKDHVYVYLTDNHNRTGRMTTRILNEWDQYTVNGSEITLNFDPTGIDGQDPYVTVYYHEMDTASYVPASMTKLGLELPTFVHIRYGRFIGHDGSYLAKLEGRHVELFDMSDTDFDIVLACLWDLEVRIYNGLVNNDHYTTVNKYYPSQHRDTWYSLNTLDNAVEKYFRKWLNKNDILDVSADNVYDPANSNTWNYSTMNLHGHMEHLEGNKLPGSWQGQYQILFGTSRPECLPWLMLGLPFKPDWWDDYYSWTDPAKRAQLIQALKTGQINHPGHLATGTEQKLSVARYYWDWENHCPVNTQGEPEDRAVVLGTPTPVDASQPLEWGDWGEIERRWRWSAEGQAAMIGAVVKLNRTRAWTDMFQPGFVVDKRNTVTQNKFKPKELQYHGGLYGESIKSVKVIESTTGMGTDTSVNIFAPANTLDTGTISNLDNQGKLTHVSVVKRGNQYNQNTAKNVYSQLALPFSYAEVDVERRVIPFQANGINVAQMNRLKRNNIKLDLEQLYTSVDTQLLVKMGGFTDKSLLNIYTESSSDGSFKLNDNDYEIVMLEGKPSRVDVVSIIRIERTNQGFRINGISNSQQRFVFNEPIRSGASPYINIELDNGVEVRRYNKFTNAESYLEFGATLSKVQDTFDFIRGHAHYLQSRGIETEIDINNSASGFANWATDAQLREVYTINVGTAVGYNSDHGHIMEFGTAPSRENILLDPYGDKLETIDLFAQRSESQLRVATRNGTVIGSAGFAEVDYEHGLLIRNKTQFNSLIFDDVTNTRQNRLRIKGKKTDGWIGHKSAAGYLVREQGINPNFDSSVNQIDYYYRTDIAVDNSDISKMEKFTNGNIDRKWSNSLQLSDAVLSDFYREMIKDKGTTGTTTKLNRSNLINLGDSTLNVQEEWMFRNGYMGDATPYKATEIEIKSQDGGDKRLIDLDDAVYVNNELDINFTKSPMDKKYIPFAGDPLSTEVKYIVSSISDMGTVFDNAADYANIPTWNGTTSYKRGDIVRRNGMLLECAVDFIGYSSTTTSLEFNGTIPSPVFSFKSQSAGDPPSARINSVNIWFDKTSTVFNEMSVTSSNSSGVLSPSDITIDGTTISLSSALPQTIVDTGATENGNPFFDTATISNPAISDNNNKTLILDGVTIELWQAGEITTPSTPQANVTRTVTGDGTSTTFTVNVSDIDQVIAENAPAGHTASLSGNTLTVTPAMAAGDQASVEFSRLPIIGNPTGVSLTAQDVVNRINAAGVADVTARLVSGKIRLVKDVGGSITGTFQISNGTANAELGVLPGTYNPVTVQIQVPQIMSTEFIRDAILAAGIDSVSAELGVNDRLVIKKSPPINVDAQTTLSVSGSAAIALGISPITTITSSQVPNTCTVNDAADFINAANIQDITASVVQNRLRIVSSGDTITIGSEFDGFTTEYELETIAGVETGEFFKIVSQTENNFRQQFRDGNWQIVSEDPALFNIFVLDDGDMDKSEIDTITSKFWGWNVMQMQSQVMYTEDATDPGCSICAGSQSPEGNDARVTVNQAHNLMVGDYVMLLNTTTQPSCDGIHRVTRVGDLTEPNSFYIDMYIEKCGESPAVFTIRNARFETGVDRESTITSDYYSPALGQLAWTSTGTNGEKSTNVHRFDGTQWVELTERYSNNRITHDKFVGASIYDYKKQVKITDLEVYDPARGLIPGVAAREIDNISPYDLAQYTHSTDLLFEGNERNAWTDDQESVTWWDTSNLKYWDYDQGNTEYRMQHWGKLIPGSTIDIYEWTKSTVPPDEYADAVDQSIEMFGTVATGQAFKKFDPTLGEDVYYYTEVEEWNNSITDYQVVYYFWVKEKLYTTDANRMYTANQLATVLRSPTDSGISWIAPIDSRQLIVANAEYYINNDTVLQLKLDSDASHNNWFILNEGTDWIPEYWYNGLRDNATGYIVGYDIELPNENLHPYNRYGDRRDIGQTWFTNKYEARRQAISVANQLLQEMNLFEDLPGQWDRTITRKSRIIDIGVDARFVPDWESGKTYRPGDRVISKYVVYQAGQSIVTTGADENIDINTNDWIMISQLYDMTRTWDYGDYIHSLHPSYKQPTLVVDSRTQVLQVNPIEHQTVRIPIYNSAEQRDESETFNWINDQWMLTMKKNATVQFNDFISNMENDIGWDTSPWDKGGWDQNTAIYTHYVIEALRKDIFVQMHQDNFNHFFFAMIKYAISVQKQVDWVYKTTYIQAEIDNRLDLQPKVYKKNTVNEIVGYLNVVKPFHTKLRTVFDKYSVDEHLDVIVTDSHLIDITIDANQLDPAETFDPITDIDTYVSTFADTEFTDVNAGTFEDDFEDIVGNKDFIDAYDWNLTGVTTGNDGYRRAIYYFKSQENLVIKTITNTTGDTVDSDSRTFAYLQDNNGFISAYMLEQDKTTTVVADAAAEDTTIELAPGTGTIFNSTGGYAIVNNELIRYEGVIQDTLMDITRSDFAAKIVSGDMIIDVTNNKLDTIRSNRLDSALRFNEIGKSILDQTSTSLDALELQANGQGTAF